MMMQKRLIQIMYVVFFILISNSCTESEAEKENINRVYTKTIVRLADNDFEAGLIKKAEKYYPPREELVDAAASWLEIPDSSYWYYNSFDGVLIAYAITEDAVNYYSSLIDEYNQTKTDNFFQSARFDYSATVSFKGNYQSPAVNSNGEEVESLSFEKVFVVELLMEWEQYCGSLCAMWIDKKRIVVFNETGELLDVFLDGTIPIPVS